MESEGFWRTRPDDVELNKERKVGPEDNPNEYRITIKKISLFFAQIVIHFAILCIFPTVLLRCIDFPRRRGINVEWKVILILHHYKRNVFFPFLLLYIMET